MLQNGRDLDTKYQRREFRRKGLQWLHADSLKTALDSDTTSERQRHCLNNSTLTTDRRPGKRLPNLNDRPNVTTMNTDHHVRTRSFTGEANNNVATNNFNILSTTPSPACWSAVVGHPAFDNILVKDA